MKFENYRRVINIETLADLLRLERVLASLQVEYWGED